MRASNSRASIPGLRLDGLLVWKAQYTFHHVLGPHRQQFLYASLSSYVQGGLARPPVSAIIWGGRRNMQARLVMETYELLLEIKLVERRLTLFEEKYGV
jgi:hypothetical protein